MDELGFDIGGLLSEEEAEKLFENQGNDTSEEQTSEEKTEETESVPAEEQDEKSSSPEKVGEEENEIGNNAVTPESDGSSPNIYSSIASALKDDGIFPDLQDTDAIKTPEDFAELFEKAIESKFDERQKRIDAALNNGVAPDTIKEYERTIQYLDSIKPDAISAEDEEGENLRKQLIYNDLINRGYSHEKAQKELEKSFKAGTDVDDAKDALESLSTFYNDGYKNAQNEAKKRTEEAQESQRKQTEEFRKMVLDSDLQIGDTKLDKATRQRVYDSVSKPIYKDEKTGQLLTAVQKFSQDNPLEFWKQMGLWYVLTDGGKNFDGVVKQQLRAEKTKAIKELGRKINTTSLNRDGSLRYASGSISDNDPLLSDGWKIGW